MRAPPPTPRVIAIAHHRAACFFFSSSCLCFFSLRVPLRGSRALGGGSPLAFWRSRHVVVVVVYNQRQHNKRCLNFKHSKKRFRCLLAAASAAVRPYAQKQKICARIGAAAAATRLNLRRRRPRAANFNDNATTRRRQRDAEGGERADERPSNKVGCDRGAGGGDGRRVHSDRRSPRAGRRRLVAAIVATHERFI